FPKVTIVYLMYPVPRSGLPQACGFLCPRARVYERTTPMTRALPLFVLAFVALLGTALPAQTREPLPGAAARERPTLSITPSRPATGSVVRLSIRRANRLGDSLVSVIGT